MGRRRISVCNVEDYDPMRDYLQCYHCGKEMLVWSSYRILRVFGKREIFCLECYKEEKEKENE